MFVSVITQFKSTVYISSVFYFPGTGCSRHTSTDQLTAQIDPSEEQRREGSGRRLVVLLQSLRLRPRRWTAVPGESERSPPEGFGLEANPEVSVLQSGLALACRAASPP